jgi:metal-responsive CopG/Arc/MetJ family transcriptional regulator
MYMKAIQVMLEEGLLARLDQDEAVRSEGRSAVIRQAIADYLRRKQSRRITSAYRKAYGGGEALGEELAGWQDEGAWPDP